MVKARQALRLASNLVYIETTVRAQALNQAGYDRRRSWDPNLYSTATQTMSTEPHRGAESHFPEDACVSHKETASIF